jgi:hypothetical protein
VNKSKDYAFAVLHTSPSTERHSRSSQSVRVCTNRCLVAAFNSELSPASATSPSQQELTMTEPQRLCNSLTHQPTPHSLTHSLHQLVLLIKSRHGPQRKHHSFIAVYCRCPQTAAVWLLISRSLPSNGPTCHEHILDFKFSQQ